MKAWLVQAYSVVDRLFSTLTNLWLFSGNHKILKWLPVDIPMIYSQHLPSYYTGSTQQSASHKTVLLPTPFSYASRYWHCPLDWYWKSVSPKRIAMNKFTFLNHITFSWVVNRRQRRWRKNDKRKKKSMKIISGFLTLSIS